MIKKFKKIFVLLFSRHHTFHLQNVVSLLIPVAFVIVLFFTISVAGKAMDSPAIDLHKYYTSVKIQNGDSLWSIAKEYISPEYKSTQAYIKEVMQLNHLTSYEIHAGGSLVVPYYRSDRR